MYLDRTAADRVARLRERRKAAGLVEVRVWVRPAQVAAVKAIEVEAMQGPARPATLLPADPAPFPEPIPVTVTFKAKPPQHLREILRNLKFGWNNERGAWLGYASDREVIEKLVRLVAGFGGKVTEE